MSFTAAPLSVKPLVALKAKVRMPKGVVYVSTTVPPTDTVVITEYMLGEASDQILGVATVTVCVTVAVFPAATEVAGDEVAPTSVPVGSPTELATVTDWALDPSFWMVTAMFTVALVVETCGVVTT
ncbi:MAG TPA: hypothetical protein VFG23_10335, partial [Polyangia bacterium]|nr:hypothetical protein [Polyangia bacterium]